MSQMGPKAAVISAPTLGPASPQSTDIGGAASALLYGPAARYKMASKINERESCVRTTRMRFCAHPNGSSPHSRTRPGISRSRLPTAPPVGPTEALRFNCSGGDPSFRTIQVCPKDRLTLPPAGS